MRLKLRVLLLLALVVPALAPSEAALGEPVGSVVGQVTSCVEASGLLRKEAELDDDAPDCGAPRPGVLVARVAALVGLLPRWAGFRRRAATSAAHRSRLHDALRGPSAAWRGPPLQV